MPTECKVPLSHFFSTAELSEKQSDSTPSALTRVPLEASTDSCLQGPQDVGGQGTVDWEQRRDTSTGGAPAGLWVCNISVTGTGQQHLTARPGDTSRKAKCLLHSPGAWKETLQVENVDLLIWNRNVGKILRTISSYFTSVIQPYQCLCYLSAHCPSMCTQRVHRADCTLITTAHTILALACLAL